MQKNAGKMKSRIEKILRDKHISSAKFADETGVQRSSVSQILSGRNKPSLDFIRKMLIRFSDINPEWLLLGRGEMYIVRSNFNISDNITRTKKQKEDIEISTEKNIIEETDLAKIAAITEKKVEKVVIFFSDNTFQEFFLQEE